MKDGSPRVTASLSSEGQPPSDATAMDRRTLLRVGAAGSMVVVALPLACADDPTLLSNGPIVFRNVSTVPVGALVAIPGAPGFVGRDEAGLYAMSATCTHKGCHIPAPTPPPGTGAIQIDCPCHGSQYDKNGTVLRGPAPAPLQHYRVDLAADGTITVQGATPVGSQVRTPVP